VRDLVRPAVAGAIRDACRRYNIQEEAVYALIQVESRGREDAVGTTHDYGLMQLTQPAVDDVQNTYQEVPEGRVMANSLTADYNVRIGTAYLSLLRGRIRNEVAGGDTTYEVPMSFIIAAYNAGPGAFSNALRRAGGNPTELTFDDLRNFLPATTGRHVDRWANYYREYGGGRYTGTTNGLAEAPIIPGTPNAVAPSLDTPTSATERRDYPGRATPGGAVGGIPPPGSLPAPLQPSTVPTGGVPLGSTPGMSVSTPPLGTGRLGYDDNREIDLSLAAPAHQGGKWRYDRGKLLPMEGTESVATIKSPSRDYSEDFFKVGDVVFRVPPQSISVTEEHGIYSFPSVRTKGSPKMRTGQGQTAINVESIFSSVDEINGYTDNGSWYGGLRGMIAQYYRAPFLPIENHTIRRIIIPDQGKMKSETLGDERSIEVERELTDNLVEIADAQDNRTIQEFVANEVRRNEDSRQRLEELKKLRNEELSQYPEIPDSKWEDSTTNPASDMQLAVVLDSFAISTVPGFPNSLRANFTFYPFNYVPYSSDFSFVVNEDDASEQASYYSTLYTDPALANREPYVEATYDISESEVYKKYYLGLFEELQRGEMDVYPVGLVPLLKRYSPRPDQRVILRYSFSAQTREMLLREELRIARQELAIARTVTDNAPDVDLPDWPWERTWRLIQAYLSYAVDATQNFRTMLKEKLGIENPRKFIWDIAKLRYIEVGKFLQDALGNKVLDLTREVETLIDLELERMDVGQYIVGLVDLNGPDTALTGITATYKNKVLPLSLVGQEYPTFQYMGGSDVNFSITLETSDLNLLEEIRLTSMRANHTQLLQGKVNSRELAKIDTSAEVEGSLFGLLGVEKVFITGVNYSTVEGKPGLFSVTINAIQADLKLDEYEILQGTKIVDLRTWRVMMSLLENPPEPRPWAMDSIWEDLSSEIRLLKEEVDRAEGERAQHRKWLDSQRADVEETIKEIGDQSWWRRLTTRIISGAFRIGKDAHSLGTATERALKYGDTYTRLYRVMQTAKGYLNTPEYVDLIQVTNDPRTQLLHSYLKENREAAKETRANTCYPDMGLPVLTGDVLDTPADFFYRRGDVITSKSINDELAVLSQTRAAKLEQMFRLNFKLAKEEVRGTSIEFNNIMKALDLLAKDTSPVSNMNDMRAKLARYQGLAGVPLYANNPAYVVYWVQSIIAAARSEKLSKRIDDMEQKRDEYIRLLGATTGPTATPLEIQAFKKKMEDRYDAALNHLKDQRASMVDPSNVISLTAIDAASMMTNWGVESFESELENRYVLNRATEVRKKDQTLHMSRAFPAFKLYFIEEDSDKWLLFDDFYSYSAVKSVTIIKSRKSASDTAVVRVSNITGILSDPLADYQREKIGMMGETADLKDEQIVDRLMLRPGCSIMIKMGYHNDPRKLETVFLGAIAELQAQEGEIELVAQGWGAQFNNPVCGKREDVDGWGWRKAHGDIVSWALGEIPGLKHFGRRNLLLNTDLGMLGGRNTDALRDSPGASMFSSIINSFLDIESGANNPADDNVYLPYNISWNLMEHVTFDWKIDAGTTAWELINEILLWYPDWIVTILPYEPIPGNISTSRLTLYVGPKDGYYRWTDKWGDDWAKYQLQVSLGKYTGDPERRNIDIGLNDMVVVTDTGSGSKEYLGITTKSYILPRYKSEYDKLVGPDVEYTKIDWVRLAGEDLLPERKSNWVGDTGFKERKRKMMASLTPLPKAYDPTSMSPFAELIRRPEAPTVIEPWKKQYFLDEPQNKLLRCFKPVRRYHFYDSDHHILDNKIAASTNFMANRVLMRYPQSLKSEPRWSEDQGGFGGLYEMIADDNIKPDHIRTYTTYHKNIDTNWWANGWRNMIMGQKDESKTRDTINYMEQLPQWVRVCNVILANQVKEMYTGELVVLGDPSVRPYDVVYAYDYQNSLVGPFEVEQVVHHFSQETGFVTTITPDLLTHIQNYSATLDTAWMSHILTWSLLTSIPAFGKGLGLFMGGVYGARAGAWAWGKLATQGMKAGLTRAAAVGVGPTTLGSLIPGVGIAAMSLWTLWSMARAVGLTYQKELGKLLGRQPITITPLTYQGKPLVAGLEGMRTDDIWVHMHDTICTIKDIPYRLIAGGFNPSR